MLLRSGLAVLSAVAVSLPLVASAEVCVAVHGPVALADKVRRSLADRGIGPPTGTCAPATLTVSVDDGETLCWALALPDGEASERVLAHTDVGAMWVDSMVRGRLDALWRARVEPLASTTTDGVRLFASFDAWKAGIPTAVLDVALVSIVVDDHLVGPDGLERMWVLDRGRREAREPGAVFAFEYAGEVYLRDDSPRAHRKKPFGRLEVYGDRGLYQYELCYWVSTDAAKGSGYVECDVQMRILDLRTGVVTKLDRAGMKALLADHPARWAAYRSERPKDARMTARHVRPLLEPVPGL